MKQLNDLLEWLNSFEKTQFEPTRQNVVEKIWQLQSEIKRKQCDIPIVSICVCNNPKPIMKNSENGISTYCQSCSKQWKR